MKTDTFQAHPRDSRRPSSIILALLLSFATALFYFPGIAAFASETTVVGLDQGAGADSQTFEQGEEDECDVEDGVQWHFILNQLDAGTAPGSLTAVFDAGSVTDPAGDPVGEGKTQHFYVSTSTHDTLLSAQATVQEQSGDPQLVLSHVCVGDTSGVGGGDDGGDDGTDDEGDDGTDDEGDDGTDDEGDDEGEVGAAQISIDIDCETVTIESDKGISLIELTFDDGSTEKYEADEDGESAGSLEDIFDSTVTNEDGEIIGGSFATPDGLVSVVVKSGSTTTDSVDAPEDCDLGDDDGGDDEGDDGADDEGDDGADDEGDDGADDEGDDGADDEGDDGADDEGDDGADDEGDDGADDEGDDGADDEGDDGADDEGDDGADDEGDDGADDEGDDGADDEGDDGADDAGDDGDDTEVGGIVEERCIGSLEIVVIGPDGNVIDGPVLLDGAPAYIETTFLDDSIDCDTYTVTLDESALAEGVSLGSVSNTDSPNAEGAVQIVTVEDGDEDRVVFELVQVKGVTLERPPAPAPDAPEQPEPAPDQQPAPEVEAGELARTGAHTQWLLLMALAALLGGTAFLRAADRRDVVRA